MVSETFSQVDVGLEILQRDSMEVQQLWDGGHREEVQCSVEE